MPRHRSIARHPNFTGKFPEGHGHCHWPLVISAAMADVMRGLWGNATNVALQNIAYTDALETQFAMAATDVHGFASLSTGSGESTMEQTNEGGARSRSVSSRPLNRFLEEP
jgi:hypothetical protein